MAIERTETPQFIYLLYRREGHHDFEKMKKELSCFSSKLSVPKDIVLDLSHLNTISSPEMGAIVRLAADLKGTGRYLRLIPSPKIKGVIESSNIGKLEHLVVYGNREVFVNQLKKLKSQMSSPSEQSNAGK
ncbi:MAG: hypothetical protein GF401_14970 [Chitinivibrionales bacterium]|nr:hypothetical protein [Chitinivibrionales bacterium]